MSANLNYRRFIPLFARGTACSALILIMTVVFSAPSWAAAKNSAVTSAPGTPRTQGGSMGSVQPARSVILQDLPAATRATKMSAEEGDRRPLDGLTDAEYNALKLEAARRAGGDHFGPGLAPSRFAPVDVNYAFLGMDESTGGSDPSDLALAVSENFVLEVVNTAIGVYDKRGNLQSGFPKSADAFWGLSGGTYTTDPRAFYDWVNHRFVIVMLTETSPFSGTNQGALLIAVSQGHDPRLGWWVYSPAFNIGGSGQCPDYPTLGHDSSNWGTGATKGGFYVGINLFGGSGHCSGSSLVSNDMFLIPNDPLYQGAGFSFWDQTGFSDGPLVDTIQAGNMNDRSDKPSSVIMINSFNIEFGGTQCSSGCNGLVVWSASNPFGFLNGGSGPVFSGVNMSTAHNYYFPPAANEPGCSGCVDTDDVRISGQVKYNAGSLWGSLNTGVPNVAGAHAIWFEVHPILDLNGNITSAEERQEDCFFCGGQGASGSSYYAVPQPDPEGNVTLVYDYSDQNDYAGVAYTARRVTYADSNMNGAGFFLEGGSGAASGRWGDYSATAPDLTVAQSPLMWFAGNYAESSGSWGTAIGAVQFTNPFSQ